MCNLLTGYPQANKVIRSRHKERKCKKSITRRNFQSNKYFGPSLLPWLRLRVCYNPHFIDGEKIWKRRLPANRTERGRKHTASARKCAPGTGATCWEGVVRRAGSVLRSETRMPGGALSWLSLKVQDRSDSRPHPVLYISIPKKVVPLATRRNRVKRLLREALKGHALKTGREYCFRVRLAPVDPSLQDVKTLVRNLFQLHG